MNKDNHNNSIENIIIEALKNVYDPEFPVVDIYTLGLIYSIHFNIEEKIINIVMTLTSPACPVGDMIVEMVKNSINEKLSDFLIETEITFEPMWSPDLIKDEDLKRMFDL